MAAIDWIIVAVYIVFAFAIGIVFSKRASKSTEDYFLSGRSLSWFMIGTSMVATTFAADTPLAITEFVRDHGIWRNWFWWAIGFTHLLAIFIFSRLWRRARVLTDIEFINLRYSGKAAVVLRVFKAFYFAVIVNLFVIGWVSKAMIEILGITIGDLGFSFLGLDPLIIICILVAGAYTLLSGFWGVIVTDLVQFFIAVAGAVLLMIMSMNTIPLHESLEKVNKRSVVEIAFSRESFPMLYQKIKVTDQEINSYSNYLFYTPNTVMTNEKVNVNPNSDIVFKYDPKSSQVYITYTGIFTESQRFIGVVSEASMAKTFDRIEFKRQDLTIYNTGNQLAVDATVSKTGKTIAILSKDISLRKTLNKRTLSFFPSFTPPDDRPLRLSDIINSDLFYVLMIILLLTWNNPSADGGGYIIQRMSSARNERHAMLGTLWFAIANYAVRAWPWIIVAVFSIIIFPNVNSTQAYPEMMKALLPAGALGIAFVGFLAAYMSTIDTHLNWGASYIENDIYRAYIKKDASERHYVIFSKITFIVMLVLGTIASVIYSSIGQAWEFVQIMGSGLGVVLILRWFWWRINAYSEIAGLGASIMMAVLFQLPFFKDFIKMLFETDTISIQHRLLVVTPISIIVWLTVTFLTKPEKEETLKSFYARVKPGGIWKHYRSGGKGILRANLILMYLFGLFLIYGLTLGVGFLLFESNWVGYLCLGFALIGVIGLYISLKKLKSQDETIDKTPPLKDETGS